MRMEREAENSRRRCGRRVTACGCSRSRVSWASCHRRHPTFEGGTLDVRGVHTHTRKQHVTTPCMHMCEACAQQLPREVQTPHCPQACPSSARRECAL